MAHSEDQDPPLPADAILVFVVRKYQELLARESPRQALTNALVQVLERKLPVRDLSTLQQVAWCIDASVGFPEPDRIDAIAADVWERVGPAEDDYEDGNRYYDPNGAEVARPPANRRTRAGKTVRGVRYRGGKRDRSADPYYVFTPANVVSAVEEKRLDASVIPYASVLYQHIRRTERYKDKGQRIRLAELGAKLHRSEASAKRAVRSMLETKELLLVSSGRGNRNGAIYRFPPRAWNRSK